MTEWTQLIASTHAGATVLAAFLASLVEFVEALTIVLAVGAVRGWRPALIGSVAGSALLAILVAALGPLLTRFPLAALQTAIGVLLLLFGMRWLRKAVLRAAGIIPLHDEIASYAAEAAALGRQGRSRGTWDAVGIAATLKAVMLEGLEVVFIVLAVGAGGGRLVPASLGAAAAFLLVVGLGIVVHRPLAQVPENGLKFAVGVLLSAFGTFWIGEGLGFVWPGEDLSIPALILAYLATALLCVRTARRAARGAKEQPA